MPLPWSACPGLNETSVENYRECQVGETVLKMKYSLKMFASLLDQQVCEKFKILLFSCTLHKHLLAAYFWYRETLDISTDVESPENINWTIGICLVSSWLLVYLAMVKGITESPKVVYVGTYISCWHHFRYFFIR